MLDAIVATDAGWYAVVVGLLVSLLLAVEVGFRGARRTIDTPETRSQTGTVAGSLLALLGFLIAFTFGMAEARFQERRSLVLEEANAIETTYLRSSFLPEAQRDASRRLLAEYVDDRLDAVRTGEVEPGLRRAKDIHSELWQQADAAFEATDLPIAVNLYVQSLNNVIDLHESRVTVAYQKRVPPSIFWALYFVSVVSLAVLGVHFGLQRVRTRVGTGALVLSLWGLLLLIVDLDQPRQRLFSVSQQPLVDVQETIHEGGRPGA